MTHVAALKHCPPCSPNSWFPKEDPFQLLQKNPSMLLNIEEADLPADPTYGEFMGWAMDRGG